MFRSGVGRVPRRRFRPAVQRLFQEPPGILAADFGWSGARVSLLPPLSSSLRDPCLTQGRVLPYLPFTVVHSSCYSDSGSGGGSSQSKSSGSLGFSERAAAALWGHLCGAEVEGLGVGFVPAAEPERRGASQPLRIPLLRRISARSWEYRWGVMCRAG